MTKLAYSSNTMDSFSAILALNFIEGVQNPHIKNKLRSYQVQNLKEIFGHAIQEDQTKKRLGHWTSELLLPQGQLTRPIVP